MKKLLGIAILATIVTALVKNRADMERYLEMRRMSA